MNGAEGLLRTARDAGIDVCFANSGTTEMPQVVALDSVAGIRPCTTVTAASACMDGVTSIGETRLIRSLLYDPPFRSPDIVAYLDSRGFRSKNDAGVGAARVAGW